MSRLKFAFNTSNGFPVYNAGLNINGNRVHVVSLDALRHDGESYDACFARVRSMGFRMYRGKHIEHGVRIQTSNPVADIEIAVLKDKPNHIRFKSYDELVNALKANEKVYCECYHFQSDMPVELTNGRVVVICPWDEDETHVFYKDNPKNVYTLNQFVKVI